MKSVANYSFHSIRDGISPDMTSEVVEIWTKSAGIALTEAQRRIQELVMVVRNDSGKIVGLSTAVKTLFPQIQNHVYAYRCFILPQYRAPALDTQMIVRSKAVLEEVSLEDHHKRCVGIMVVVQNEILKRHWRQAVWPGADMIYVGDTPQGHHIRIGYFKGARI